MHQPGLQETIKRFRDATQVLNQSKQVNVKTLKKVLPPVPAGSGSKSQTVVQADSPAFNHRTQKTQIHLRKVDMLIHNRDVCVVKLHRLLIYQK